MGNSMPVPTQAPRSGVIAPFHATSAFTDATLDATGALPSVCVRGTRCCTHHFLPHSIVPDMVTRAQPAADTAGSSHQRLRVPVTKLICDSLARGHEVGVPP